MRSCGIFTCCIRSATGWVRLRPWSASTGWVVPPTHAGVCETRVPDSALLEHRPESNRLRARVEDRHGPIRLGFRQEVCAGVEHRCPSVIGELALVVVAVTDEIVRLAGGDRLNLGFALAVEDGNGEPVELEVRELTVQLTLTAQRVEGGLKVGDVAVVVPENAVEFELPRSTARSAGQMKSPQWMTISTPSSRKISMARSVASALSCVSEMIPMFILVRARASH